MLKVSFTFNSSYKFSGRKNLVIEVIDILTVGEEKAYIYV